MAVPEWLSYAGPIDSVVGTITGVAGAIMGFISYRRSSSIKRLDLRLELRRKEAEARLTLEGLPGLLDSANASRRAMLSANGRLNSGTYVLWEQDLVTDRGTMADLANSLPTIEQDHSKKGDVELEAALVKIHDLQLRLGKLIEKYRSAMVFDDRDRENLQAAIRTAHPSR